MALVYSCCFWFSLRLGGIFIAIFSILQGLAVLIFSSVAYSQEHSVKESTAALVDSFNLIYVKPYLENFYADPPKYLSLGISLSAVYIIICLFYAYGAYRLNNIFMIGYILVELLRLLFLSFLIITWLLVIKENTMDIGVHIGTSVIGSFFLLGMYYLWICAANLPILINEMERDQQNATIYKLQKMVETNNTMYVKSPKNTGMTPLEMGLNLDSTPVFARKNLNKNDIFKRPYDENYQYPIYSHFNH